MIPKQKQTGGFALLLTVVVVSILVAVGISLLDNTIKQLNLSGLGRESEKAFHAAYAGAECAYYWVSRNQDGFLQASIPAAPPDPARAYYLGGDGVHCFKDINSYVTVYSEDAPNVHHSRYTVDTGVGADGRCNAMNIYVFDAATAGSDVTYTIPGLGNRTCDDGNRCTYILSRGYNFSCSEILVGARSVQRQVVIEF